MAFGDKVSWFGIDDTGNIVQGSIINNPAVATNAAPDSSGWLNKTPQQILEDVTMLLATVDVGVPLPEVKQHTKSVPLSCCEDAFNLSVKFGVGTPFCLKCRKELTIEHFNRVLGIK